MLRHHYELKNNWGLVRTESQQYNTPTDLQQININWVPATVPGTVAQAYAQAKLWSINKQIDFDQYDWWYKIQFSHHTETTSPYLHFTGLASICDIWLNNKHILSAENMFITYPLNVQQVLQEENELYICFRSLSHYLKQKRSRPRWKTKLISQQPLRWVRTTLLGRIPGWTPPIAAVGPWQPVYFTNNFIPANIHLKLKTIDTSGFVEFSCHLYGTTAQEIKATLTINNTTTTIQVIKEASGYTLKGQLTLNDIEHWWPHTHGQAKLYTPELIININSTTTNYLLTPIGFKNIHIEQANNNFNVVVNGQSIFCRGACWTINDIVSLQGDSHNLEQTLTLMRDAGANMIRIGGTMIYEQDLFYQLCDQLGIMVWQDFMFANMDYPIDDPAFQHNVDTEIQQTLNRLCQHVCISIYCGNSEIEQQAAMLGLPESESQNSLFTEQIPKHCNKLHPDIPYITSSPTGAIQPFHTNKKVAHYYGIGAYQRPLSELRQHDVKFTSECLGFANIPVTKTRNQVLDGQLPVSHHPKWKERTPRDTGAGWDFEDVRDHYTQSIFNIDPVKTRCYDSEHYFALSEITTGEIMSQVFSEWRSTHSQCAGGLVWFLKDFWPGAGWGIIDSKGLPKACYYYLKRCWQPLNIVLTNESLNGIDIHVINESTTDFKGQLELSLLNKQSLEIIKESINITVNAGTTTTYNSDKILPHFWDVTYSYRFGPVKHNIVAAQLIDNSGELTSNAFYFPNAELPYSDPNAKLTAIAKETDNGNYELELTCNRFLYAVTIEVNGYIASSNFFHMLPNTTTLITMTKIISTTSRYKGYVGALNLTEDVKIKVSTE